MWFILEGSNKTGPYDLAKLQKLFSEGKIQLSTQLLPAKGPSETISVATVFHDYSDPATLIIDTLHAAKSKNPGQASSSKTDLDLLITPSPSRNLRKPVLLGIATLGALGIVLGLSLLVRNCSSLNYTVNSTANSTAPERQSAPAYEPPPLQAEIPFQAPQINMQAPPMPASPPDQVPAQAGPYEAAQPPQVEAQVQAPGPPPEETQPPSNEPPPEYPPAENPPSEAVPAGQFMPEPTPNEGGG